MAGPCSAESEAQLRAVTAALKDLNVDTIRAGVWKPRTRPNNFEGKGTEALQWISDIRKEYDVRFAIEVASPYHVEKALEYGIDVLWLGTRTTVNPFLVQEIADAMKGAEVAAMVKNPINPDLELWIGAIERIYNAGITQIAAVHRGFSFFQKSKFRNIPIWQIPLALKSRIPEVTLFCDPSHIAGKRDLVMEVSQQALDLNYDGLMIEVHPDPENALSDPEQQLHPKTMGDMLNHLESRKPTSQDAFFINKLEELREKIDNIDRELLETLATRMKVVEQIGDYKKENNVAIFQLERWNEILESRPEWGKFLEMNPEFIVELYKLVHDESLKIQTDILKKSPADKQ